MNKMVNGVLVPMTDAEIEARNAETAQAQAQEAATLYKEKRAAEYPSVLDQLDDLYHNGYDGWRATIQAVKAKYPKPSES
jgi:hypothetical protein